MNRLKEFNEDAYKYLVDGSIPERQWTLIHDGGHRYGVRTTNMSEAFNGVMKGARSLPITSLVRITFFRVNEYFATRRDLGRNRLDNGHVYAKKPIDTIDKNAEKARFHDVRIYDTVRGIFEVTIGCGNRIAGKGGKSYMFDLTATSCSCQKPTIFKLPCSHVLAVCRARNISYDVFVDPSFRTTKYVSTYKKTFMPVPDMFTCDPWNDPTVVPDPSTKRGKGRPRSTRIRNKMESPLTRPRNTCSFCGFSGHNKSWGSVALAYPYRNLCRASRKGAKDIGGCLMLLQIWSWEHIYIGRPIIRTIRPDGQHDQEDDADDFEPVLGSQHRCGMDPLPVSWLRVYLSRSYSPHTLVYYRDALDRQQDEQMTWQPYTAAKMDALPHICTSGHEIWRSRCPLICFDIVELHLPDRVMRQFGLEQVIPQAYDTQPQLHAIDRRTGDKN
ncbi:uncharacterized protein LOC130806685 [Amaranthus tricolor]|uniref:uncharacterized protein LOC130806685 n=1 Tax=Amaranthus tricolor TaxID=29722 RepID=UPI002586AF41|nr:uncharacterized protein LOC130806685 [Amaranthus tricolor]